MYFLLKQNCRNPFTKKEEIFEVYNLGEACGKMGTAIDRGANYAELWKDGKLIACAYPCGNCIIINNKTERDAQ